MVYRVKILPFAAPLGNAIPSQFPYPIVTNEANMACCWSMGMRKPIEDPQTLTTSFF